MCDFGITATVMTIAATAISVAGQMQAQNVQEKSARNAAEYNAQVAENEAATQRQLAQNEMAKGVADKERQQRNAARAMGGMRAGMGASGLTLDSGTNLSLLEESATEHQYDSNIIMQNAETAAWQHMVGVTGAENNQAFARYQAANADSGRGAAYLSMGGSLLGGIGKGIGQYNEWNRLQPAKSGYWGASGGPNGLRSGSEWR